MFGTSRFAIVPRNLGRQLLFRQKKCKKNLIIFFWKKRCLFPCPKRIKPLIKPLLENSFSTHIQGTGPCEGPFHFSRSVLRVHNCSIFIQNILHFFSLSSSSSSCFSSFSSSSSSSCFSSFSSSSSSSSLSSSSSSSLSLLLFLFLSFPLSFSFSYYTLNKTIKQATQSTCNKVLQVLQALQISQVHQQENS